MTFEQKKQIYQDDEKLLPRQREILKQLLQGITQKNIKAINPLTKKEFGLSTIKADIKHIYVILGLQGENRGQIKLMSECYDWFPIIYDIKNSPCNECFRSPKHHNQLSENDTQIATK